jgi:hypothetical protein
LLFYKLNGSKTAWNFHYIFSLFFLHFPNFPRSCYIRERRSCLIPLFITVYLNMANSVLAVIDLSTGGLTGTVADVRLIFAAALKLNATAIAVCHNHPSGHLQPSNHDEILTEKIKQAGNQQKGTK